ncbi:hypothetical protein [Streptomyces sp. NPDC095613]|uniref:hypothetical protein n=1 Tax=Streptomyces sp. NPDC095613 TaxID=3155540 RepID=UPI003316DBD6
MPGASPPSRAGSPPTTSTSATSTSPATARSACAKASIRTPSSRSKLSAGLLRQRLDETIEGLVDDVRQRNIEARTEEAERELLRSLQGSVQKVVQGTADKLPAAADNQ